MESGYPYKYRGFPARRQRANHWVRRMWTPSEDGVHHAMPSLECPRAAHRVIRTVSHGQSNVYAAAEGDDMQARL
jgi:hypothetical protein